MKRDSPANANSQLRILMVAPTSFFADYGCHVRIYEEIRALQRRGHRVRVCTYHNGNDVAGIDIHRSVDVPWLKRAEVGSSRHKAYLDVALFIETLRQALVWRPDIIHAHLHEGALVGGMIGRLLRVPVIFDYQGSLTEEMLDHGFIRERGKRERFFRWLERRIDRLPAAVVPSGIAGERYLRASGLSPRRIRPIPDGVDVRRFDPERHGESRERLQTWLGVPDNTRVVIYLGLLAEYQGLSTLLEAARLLRLRRDDLVFVVAGYPAVERYAQRARALGIADSVRFPGRVAYELAPALLSAGDVAVAPKVSTTESNGKLFNYMAMRLPVVASDTRTNRAILGGLGHLFPPQDAGALADAIETALLDGNAERDALRTRIVTHYAWDERVRDLEAVYAEALGRPVDAPAPATARLPESAAAQ